MTVALQLPFDAPHAGSAHLGTWLTERVPLPVAVATADPVCVLAAVSAVLARLSGQTRIGSLFERSGARTAIEVEVGYDATVADVLRSADAALNRPSGLDSGHVNIRIEPSGGRPTGDRGTADLCVAVEKETPDAGARAPSLRVAVSGPAALFMGSTLLFIAEAMSRVLVVILAGDGSVPVAQLPLLSEQQLQVVRRMNDTDAPIADRGVHETIAELCHRYPDREAVAGAGYTLTYGALRDCVGALAAELRSSGVSRDDPVYLCLPRGPELVVAWLAVLEIGALCLPLDPDYPPQRLHELTRSDADAPVLAASPAAVPFADPARVLRVGPAGPGESAGLAVPWPLPRHTAQDASAYAIHTSGSTGTPKAAVIEHRSLTNLLEGTATQFGLSSGRRVLAAASPGFNVSVWELFAPLYAGATVVPFTEPELTQRSLAEFADAMSVDTVFLLATLLARLDPAEFPGVRTVITGGESFTAALVDRWQPGRDLIYVYGPTEATVFQSWHRCHAGAPTRPATIGRPMRNLRFHVLDRWGAIAAPGTVGELSIAGAGPARGYRNRPDDTQRAFGSDRFRPGSGGRLYRTGDLASQRPDGTLDFRGRVDRRLKIRGFRIEPGEVEARLCGLHGVIDAAVVATITGRTDGEPVLAAYVIMRAGADPAALRVRLADELPYYMVPAAVVPVEDFPRTPNGKIDRIALASRPLPSIRCAPPKSREPVGGDRHEADGARPGTVDERVRALMSATLGAVDLTPDEDIFALGCDSLTAANLAAGLTAAFTVPVRVRDVFTYSSCALLSERIRQLTADRGGRDDAAPGQSWARAADLDPAAPIPFSPAQSGLWLHMQALPDGGTAYNVPLLLRCSDNLSPEALAAAYREIQRHHSILRTRVVTESGAAHLVADRDPVDLEFNAREEEREEGYAEPDQDARLRLLVDQPFDLGRGPLIRAALFAGPGDEQRLLLVAHHLICDGSSLEILTRDLAERHDRIRAGHTRAEPNRGVPSGLAAATAAARDAAAAAAAADLAYWRGRLEPPLAPLALPVDHARVAAPGGRTATITRALPAVMLDAAHDAVNQPRTSTFALLLAAVGVVLRHVTGSDEVSVGTAVDLRSRLGLAETVGCCINTVVLRLPVDGASSFGQLADAAAAEVIDAVDHAATPFPLVVDELVPPRTAYRNPYFDVWITLYPETVAGGPGGLRLTGGPVPVAAGLFDLSFQFRKLASGITLVLQYDSGLYERTTATALADRLVSVLREAARQPAIPIDRLDLRTPDERVVHERPLFAGFRFDQPRPAASPGRRASIEGQL